MALVARRVGAWEREALAALQRSPLLFGWLIVGPVVTFLLHGAPGLVQAIVNLVLAGIWVLLIRWLTPEPPAPAPVRRPRRELAGGLLIFALFFAVQLLFFNVIVAPPWTGWVVAVEGAMRRAATSLQAMGLPVWAGQDLYLAFSSSAKQLLPLLALALVLRISPRSLGIRSGYAKLTAVLLGLTVLFGLPFGLVTVTPLTQVIGLYLIGLFVNALPEELLFRGLLLRRLEVILRHSTNALVLSALLFNAIHIPIAIYHGTPPLIAALDVFSLLYPSGLVWGYLYLRTRSILPGVLWHAANTRLGIILASIVG